jgi:type I restriction enzyme S subunit
MTTSEWQSTPIGVLPVDWHYGTIEEIARRHKGAIKIGPFGSQLKKQDLSTFGYKVYGQENVIKADFSLGNRFISTYKFNELRSVQLHPGDIVMTMMGTIGLSAVVPDAIQPGIMDSHLLRIQPDHSIVDPTYLVKLLRDSENLKRQIRAKSQGGIMSGLNASIVKSLIVPLPALPEQKKIAAILDSVDDAIQATQAVIDQTRKVKQGLLQQLLTQGIGHTRFKQTEIGKIPESWQVLPAEEVCDVVIDCKNRTPIFTDVGYPVVRTPNVRDGRFVTTDLKFTDRESYEEWTKRGKPRPGDVLITREAPIGEVCLIPEGLDVCLGQRMMLYRPNPQLLDNMFMLMALLSPLIQERLLLLAGGSTVGHVRVGDIRNLLIPVPPLDEQRQIASVLGAVDESLDSALLRLEMMISLKTGLMADLLTGRKRVEVSA